MSREVRIFKTFSGSTLADYYYYFAVPGDCRTALTVVVAATGSPVAVQKLQRYENSASAWVDYDIGDESFTDPASGTATSKIRVVLEPGRYRYFYDRTSGGDASGLVGELNIVEE